MQSNRNIRPEMEIVLGFIAQWLWDLFWKKGGINRYKTALRADFPEHSLVETLAPPGTGYVILGKALILSILLLPYLLQWVTLVLISMMLQSKVIYMMN